MQNKKKSSKLIWIHQFGLDDEKAYNWGKHYDSTIIEKMDQVAANLIMEIKGYYSIKYQCDLYQKKVL